VHPIVIKDMENRSERDSEDNTESSAKSCTNNSKEKDIERRKSESLAHHKCIEKRSLDLL